MLTVQSWAICALCLIGCNLGIKQTSYVKVASCGFSESTMENITLKTLPSKDPLECGRHCSRHAECEGFYVHDVSSTCTLMSETRNSSCFKQIKEGVLYNIVQVVHTKSAEEVNCVKSIGNGGAPFNSSSAYFPSHTPISRIRLFYDAPIETAQYLYGIEVSHGSEMVSACNTKYLGIGDCILTDGEFIQRIELVRRLWWYGMQETGAITFVTTHKTCGPYGTVAGGTLMVFEGNNLLYISGSCGQAFDCLTFHFESC